MCSDSGARPGPAVAVVRHRLRRTELPRVRRSTVSRVDGSPPAPSMTGARFVSLTQPPAGGSALHRASDRAVRRVGRLGQFLGAAQPMAGEGALSIEVGAGAAVVFAEARLGEQRHFLHLMGAKHLPAEAPGAGGVNLVSGLCLFSSATLWGRDERGGRVEISHARGGALRCPLARIEAAAELSLYEYESVLRRARLLADLVAALPRAVPVSITIDIPRVQYYLYLLDALGSGLVSPGLALEWFRTVDVRHALTTGFLRERLSAELARASRQDVVVKESSALGELAPYLRGAVRRGGLPRAEDLAAVLAGGDLVWKLLLDLQPPPDVAALGPASYVVEELRAAHIHEDSAPGIGIAVEDRSEWKVFDRSRKLLRGMGDGQGAASGRLIGLYPLERLLTLDPYGRWASSYFHDPGRHALDEEGGLVDLFTVAEALYA